MKGIRSSSRRGAPALDTDGSGEPMLLESDQQEIAPGVHVRSRKGVWVISSDSASLVVNGTPTHESILHDGDEIALSGKVYFFRSGAPENVPAVERRKVPRSVLVVLLLALVSVVAGLVFVPRKGAPMELPPEVGEASAETATTDLEATDARPLTLREVREQFRIAEELYAKRNARLPNLHHAIEQWNRIRTSLVADNRSPDLLDVVEGRLTHAEAELESRVSEAKRQAVASHRLGRADLERSYLLQVQALIPDADAPDHLWAEERLRMAAAAADPADESQTKLLE